MWWPVHPLLSGNQVSPTTSSLVIIALSCHFEFTKWKHFFSLSVSLSFQHWATTMTLVMFHTNLIRNIHKNRCSKTQRQYSVLRWFEMTTSHTCSHHWWNEIITPKSFISKTIYGEHALVWKSLLKAEASAFFPSLYLPMHILEHKIINSKQMNSSVHQSTSLLDHND